MGITAFILAAGRGTRLHPHTENRPKCLTVLGGQTLIDRQLATLRAAGIDDIVIVTGYRADMLTLPGTRQVHNPRWADTNMVESLFCAEGEFRDDLLVCYGDIIYEPRVLVALLDSPHPVSVAVDRQWRSYWNARFDDPLSDAESLRLDPQNRITDIGNKVDDIDEIEAQYMGLMRFRGEGIEALREARANFAKVRRQWMEDRPIVRAYLTDLLIEIVLMGRAVHAVPVDGGWLEIDTLKDYDNAVAMFADGSIKRFFDPEATARAVS